MKLLFVNVQMLPIIGEAKELGVEEYKKLIFKLLNDYNNPEYGSLARDKYIQFLYAEEKGKELLGGQILIFKKPPPYKDLKTDKITRIPEPNEVEKSIRLNFFFDLKHHIMAIEKHPIEINSGETVERKIKTLFAERIEASKAYEDYYLDITVLTKLSELKKVINADMVEYFSVKLSFPNGNEFQESILDDMKDDRSGLEYREKSFPRSFMKGVSKLGKKLASFATMYGNVKMKYFDYDKGKFQTFILKNKPIESTIDNDEHLFTEDFIRDEIVKALNETRLIDSDD